MNAYRKKCCQQCIRSCNNCINHLKNQEQTDKVKECILYCEDCIKCCNSCLECCCDNPLKKHIVEMYKIMKICKDGSFNCHIKCKNLKHKECYECFNSLKCAEDCKKCMMSCLF